MLEGADHQRVQVAGQHPGRVLDGLAAPELGVAGGSMTAPPPSLGVVTAPVPMSTAFTSPSTMSVLKTVFAAYATPPLSASTSGSVEATFA